MKWTPEYDEDRFEEFMRECERFRDDFAIDVSDTQVHAYISWRALFALLFVVALIVGYFYL